MLTLRCDCVNNEIDLTFNVEKQTKEIKKIVLLSRKKIMMTQIKNQSKDYICTCTP